MCGGQRTPSFLRQYSLVWGSLIRIRWVTSEPQGFTCICFFSSGTSLLAHNFNHEVVPGDMVGLFCGHGKLWQVINTEREIVVKEDFVISLKHYANYS